MKEFEAPAWLIGGNGKVPVVGDGSACPVDRRTGESSKVVGLSPGGMVR